MLNYIDAFAAVAESGSISLAARRLGVAQPAISRQMKMLESAIGTPLLDRDHDGIQLTPAGMKLRDHVVPWLRDLDALRNVLQGEEGGGVIRFGSLTEAGQAFFMPRLLRYRMIRQDVDLKILYAKEHELRGAFDRGDLDVIITTAEVKGKGVACDVLQTERSFLVARSAFRSQINSAAEFRYSRFVAYRDDDPLLNAYVSKHYPKVTLDQLNIAISVNSHRSMIDALMTMDAVAVMPQQSIHDSLQAKLLHVVSKRELQGRLYISTRQTFSDSRLGRTFLDHLSAAE